MDEALIIKHCSPTLAGIKTGSLFNYSFKQVDDLKNEIKNVNLRLNKSGVMVRLLKVTDHRALIYVYRPGMLINDFSCEETRCYLCSNGYRPCQPEKCIERLSHRIQQQSDFPHEIGLFLGYPFADVSGFIKNNGSNFKCVGCWKVYSDACKAEKMFRRYEKCKRVYCKRFAEGLSLQQLTVKADRNRISA